MATWSFIEYLNNANYTPSAHSSWSQYSVVLKQGDTLSVNTIYNGSNSDAAEVKYVTAPSSNTTVNDPDPSPTTNNNNLLNKTWSTSSFSNSNHHTRWFFFTATAAGPGIANGYAGIRILTIPSTMGWSSVQANIEQGVSGNARLTIPSSFESYIQGTASESGDPLLSTNGSKDERFHWRITSSSSSNTAVSAGFTSSYGDLSGPSNADDVTISPGFTTSPGTYYIKLYHYDYTGSTGTSATLIDTGSFNVTAAAALDTSITLTTDKFTLTETASSYSGHTMTGGSTNTLYYILNVNNFADGSNIDALRQNGDSRYIARTFNSVVATRTFETIQNYGTITNDLPTTGNYKTYYVYAANGNGQNSTKLTNTYTVGRADTSISIQANGLTAGAETLTYDSTADVTINVTGDTSGTQYRLYTNNIPRWVSTYTSTGGNNTQDFTISKSDPVDSVDELPGVGQSFTYFSQARVTGQGGPFINTGDSITISRQSTPSDTTPNQFTFNDITNANPGQQYEHTITVSGINAAAAISITGVGTAQYKIGSGSYTTSSGTVTNGQTVTVKVTASNNASSTTSGTLNIGGVTDTFSVTTASGTTGSSATLPSVSGGYGLKCTGPNGSSVVFSPDHRAINIIAANTVTLYKSDNTDGNPSTETVTNVSGAADASKVQVSFSYTYFAANFFISVGRSSANGGTITFSNNSTSSGGADYTITYIITRVG